MSRQLTPDSSLETLKKEAKRWLKALRAGNSRAQARLSAATGAAPANPSLREVQFALAREHGLSGWAALREALEDLALSRRSHTERVEIVLHAANWGGDRIAAARVLARWPEITADNLYIAVATGNREEVQPGARADRSTGNLSFIWRIRGCRAVRRTVSPSPQCSSTMALIPTRSGTTAGRIHSRC
jgi:hypothetical protein